MGSENQETAFVLSTLKVHAVSSVSILCDSIAMLRQCFGDASSDRTTLT
jgi:hypothetical protein